MKDFENKIIKKLGYIDDYFINMDRQQIKDIINEARVIAEEAKSEKWRIFLRSEEEYYIDKYEESCKSNLQAYEMDIKENPEEVNYYILHSLGVAYYTIEKFDKAVECYTKVIQNKPDYFYAYINRATVYRIEGKFEEALKDVEYVLSVTDKKDEVYFDAVEAKGRILTDQEDYDGALTILQSIYEDKKSDAQFLDAVALVYIKQKIYDKAKECYIKALNVCKDESFKEYINIKTKYLESFKGQYKEDIPENIILELDNEKRALITRIFVGVRDKTTLIQKYSDKYKLERRKRELWHKDDYIMCLKGWSSSTPEFSLGLWDKRIKCGGGFYLHYNGKGIVIDPGLNFIENLHEQNLYIQDIDIVIVTHNHLDHNSDLAKIFDMSYQTKKTIQYFLDKETYSKYLREIEDVEKTGGGLIKKIYPDAIENKRNIQIKIGKEKITLVAYPTEHNCAGSYGFKLYLKENVLGYTSDTAYNPDIGDFFKDAKIIIVNISETNEEDIKLKMYKENHLGVYGICSLLADMNGSEIMCLLTEFWGGLGDIRLELAQIIKMHLKRDDIDIIPLDNGMIYFFNDKLFLCNSCGKKFEKNGRNIIRMGRQNKEILCLCNDCTYK